MTKNNMKLQHSTITSKGQVTIPSYIRDRLSLTSGSKLEFIIQDESFLVVPINRSITNLKGILQKPNVSLTTQEMKEIIRSAYDSH